MGHGAPLILHHGSAITGRERNLIVGYEMDAQEGMLINKEVTGLGGGSDGTIVGARQGQDRIHGKILCFDGTDDIATYTVAGVNTQIAGCLKFSMRPRDALAGDNFFHQAAVVSYYSVYAFNNVLRTRIGDAGAQATAHTFLLSKWVRILVTWSSTHAWVYVDGVLVDDYVTSFTDNLVAGRLGAQIGPVFNAYCDMADFSFETRTHDSADALRDYLQYARRAWYLESFRAAHVSSAATAAGRLENTHWTVVNAGATDMRIAHDLESERIFGIKNSKYILCGGDGQLWIPSQSLGFKAADPEAAYGTWEFWVKKAEGSVFEIDFISDIADPTSFNGYYFRVNAAESIFLREIAGGGVTGTIMQNTNALFPVAVWTKVTIARRYDGRFSLYLNNELMPATFGANPGTDNTYTHSSFIVADLDAGDALGPVTHRWGEVL